MDMTALIKQMWQKKVTVIIITIFVFLLTVAITLTQPLRYSVTTRLLVVQNYSAGTDAYGIARSNQYLSNVLAQIVYSDAFHDQVMNSGFNISASNFPTNDVERRKFWLKMIDSRAIGDTGMIEVVTYHQDKRFADQVNRAIAYILQTKNNEYHGLGDKVRVKVIDNSMTSSWPVKPNILFNSLFGLFMGLVLSACYIMIWPDKDLVIRKKTEDQKEIAVPQYEPIKQTPAPLVAEIRLNNNYTDNTPITPLVVEQKIEPELVIAKPLAPAINPEVPANLPFSDETPIYNSAPVANNPFLQTESKKLDGDIANIMN